MNATIRIIGYREGGNCDHCGRALRHCVQIDDGRTVGATCLDKKISKPKIHNGKSFRLGAEYIIKAAKVVERVNPANWSVYGVNSESIEFETVEAAR